MKNKRFETIIASDDKHHRLFCEIYFEGLFFATISQERGEGVFDIETPELGLSENRITRKARFEEFQEAVETAMRRLRGEEQ